jgi:hypothetical protein
MDRNLNKLVNFWMDKDMYRHVREKALRESVNLSSLLRTMLQDWLEGRYRPGDEQASVQGEKQGETE